MPSWRERVLAHFVPELARLWLAADPDSVLQEESTLEALRARGFELLPYDDPAAFRFAYESAYRSRWDRGVDTRSSVILHLVSSDVSTLAHDLRMAGRTVPLSLAELFPELDYAVIAGLAREHLDALDQAVMQNRPTQLGENGTKDFVLRHVFRFDPTQITSDADLLQALLRLHTPGRTLPTILANRLADRLRTQGTFGEWPLERLLAERDTFFRFLQERWPRFVARQADGGDTRAISELSLVYEVEGPVDLPLAHDDVRPFVDTLFLEGMLQPVDAPLGTEAQLVDVSSAWVEVGLKHSTVAEGKYRLERLLERAEQDAPAADARYPEWLAFARVWAELVLLWQDIAVVKESGVVDSLLSLRDRIDRSFLDWVTHRYAALYTALGADPIMLHHLPRTLARHLESAADSRVALLVLDGLALDQWLILREALTKQRPTLSYDEASLFAWLPTVTSVSRQSLFAGKPPMHFPTSIRSTAREESLWRQFWIGTGHQSREVGFLKGLGQPGSLDHIVALLTQPLLRVVGLVVDTVDEIVHGTPLGTLGVHAEVREWSTQGYMAELLDLLFDAGYAVFLTSDHGNIEAVGCGNPAEASLSVSRGERVRIFEDEVLRQQVQQRVPEAIAWSPVGLPGDYLPLIAPGRTAFVAKGERRVSHGGISVEELIVPYVRISRGGR